MASLSHLVALPESATSYSLLAALHRVGSNNNAWLPWLFIAGSLVLAVAITYHRQKQINQNLSRLGDKLGLTLYNSKGHGGFSLRKPALLGRHRAREVGFFTFVTGTNKSKHPWVGVFAACGGQNDWIGEIACRPKFWTLRLPFNRRVYFEAHAENPNEGKAVLSSYRKVPNLAMAPSGDEALDRLYTIKSNLPDGFPAKALAAVRDRLIDDQPANGQLAINHGQVLFIYPGSFTREKDTDRIAGKLDLVCDVAEKIET